MRLSTKKLVYSALFAAVSFVLTALVHFPIFPAANWLEFNLGDMPLVFSAVVFGPWYGLAVTAVACVLQGIMLSAQSGFIGIIMHFFSTGAFVLCTGLILKNKSKNLRVAGALICGAITQILVMIPLNLTISPAFLNGNRIAAQDISAVLKCFVTLPDNKYAAVCGAAFAAAFIVAFAIALVYTVERSGRKDMAGIKGTVCGVISGIIYGFMVMFAMNVIFSNVEFSAMASLIKDMMFTVYVPFNAIKAVSCAIVAYILYIAVGRYIRLMLNTTKNDKNK